MALTANDGTRQSTLNLISRVVGMPIGYARMTGWYINRSDPSFTAMFDLFLSAEHASQCDKDGQASAIHYEWGCTLRTPDDLEALAQSDDRAVLYKHVEYILHYQDAERRRSEDPDAFDSTAEEALLVELETALGITSLFHFSKGTR